MPTWVLPGTETFDRCFLFDENGGDFIEGYYIVGLLAESHACDKDHGQRRSVVHDPRLTWNTQD